MIRLLLSYSLLVFFGISVHGQIVVSPLTLNLNKTNRIGNFIVKNSSNKTYEVTISLSYGYAKTDTLGNLTFYYPDSSDTDRRFSCVEWISFFPKKILLEPEQKQIIRFTANPPDNLVYPYYFARISVMSEESEPFKAEPAQGLTAKIKIAVRQNTSLIYKNREPKQFFLVDTNVNVYKDKNILVAKLFNPDFAMFGGFAKIIFLDEKNEVFSQAIPLKVYAMDYFLKYDLENAKIEEILKATKAKIEISEELEDSEVSQQNYKSKIQILEFKPRFRIK